MSEWNNIFGCSKQKSATINMCGGCAEWWNYKLVFEKINRKEWKYKLYREDGLGLHILPSKLIFRELDDGVESVKEVLDLESYKLNDGEIIIDYDFFFGCENNW